MVKINSELPFSSEQSNVPTVDNNNMIPTVCQRVENRLVLALQNSGDLFGRVKRVLPFSVVQIPEATRVCKKSIE